VEFVDTHCHIQSIGHSAAGEEMTTKLWSKLEEISPQAVIDRAKEQAVVKLISVGCSLEDSRLAIKTATEFDNVWASIGIHPHEAKLHTKSKILDDFKALSLDPKVIAVGECGLDYYYEHSPKEDQKKLLEFQLELALDNNLPLIFHVRDAYSDFWPIFNSYNSVDKPIRGVLHSFTDSKENLELAIAHGLYIGVNGIATFTKDPGQIAMYASIPLANMVLETDSPFLTPSPFRGTINEPKNVRTIAEHLVVLRDESLLQLAKSTTENVGHLFKI
jgi:TatD DNase family protein